MAYTSNSGLSHESINLPQKGHKTKNKSKFDFSMRWLLQIVVDVVFQLNIYTQNKGTICKKTDEHFSRQ